MHFSEFPRRSGFGSALGAKTHRMVSRGAGELRMSPCHDDCQLQTQAFTSSPSSTSHLLVSGSTVPPSHPQGNFKPSSCPHYLDGVRLGVSAALRVAGSASGGMRQRLPSRSLCQPERRWLPLVVLLLAIALLAAASGTAQADPAAIKVKPDQRESH